MKQDPVHTCLVLGNSQITDLCGVRQCDFCSPHCKCFPESNSHQVQWQEKTIRKTDPNVSVLMEKLIENVIMTRGIQKFTLFRSKPIVPSKTLCCKLILSAGSVVYTTCYWHLPRAPDIFLPCMGLKLGLKLGLSPCNVRCCIIELPLLPLAIHEALYFVKNH